MAAGRQQCCTRYMGTRMPAPYTSEESKELLDKSRSKLYVRLYAQDERRGASNVARDIGGAGVEAFTRERQRVQRDAILWVRLVHDAREP